MADQSKVARMKEELAKDNRDVADLWTDALKQYKGIVGVELLPQFTDVNAMIAFGTDQMNNFHQFRHNKKKVDKLRSLLIANIDYIQKGAQQLIAAATPAFPPAAAIGTAFTYMLSACKSVSADYDVVTAFFEDMNAFLQRITILESRLPSYPAYRNCLMDVFTSILAMCGFATKFIELGRFKKWILNMIRGEDSELGGARKKMDTTLSRLQSATEYAILGNTEELQRMNSDLQQNQEMQTKMMESQTKMLETVLEGQDSVRNDLKNIQKLLMVFEERRRDDGSKQRVSKAAGQNKPPTSNRVRSFFQQTLNPIHEYHNIKYSFIPDTANWIFEEPSWNAWVTQEKGKDSARIFALSGPPGAGKSHLAASAYDHLVELAKRDTSGNTCVTCFFFRETTKDLDEFLNAINWIVLQLSEQNIALCEKINIEIERDDLEIDTDDWEDVWTKLIRPMFPATSSKRLQIVLDGLDELPEWERDGLVKFLKTFSDTSDLNISILCTTRPELDSKLREFGAEIIAVTKEKQLPDLKALIWNHLNNDGGLYKFSRFMKQRISSELEEKADGMLYAEHKLRQFNALGREPVVLKMLEQQMPDNLEQLYQQMMADLTSRTPVDQQASMKTLFYWLTYSYRPLTLDECISLLKLVPGHSINLEDELQGLQLTKFLRIADIEERNASNLDTTPDLYVSSGSDADAAYNDGDLPLKFQERSMRGFFRGARDGEKSLRMPHSEAHREMFITCSNILSGKAKNVNDGLREYAAGFWAFHLSWTSIQNDSEAEKIAATEALGAIITNESNIASLIEELGVDYDEINEMFNEGDMVAHMATYAQVANSLSNKINSVTAAWARSVISNRSIAFIPLAKGHVLNWLRAPDLESALRSYRFARSILKMTYLSNLIKEDDEDDNDSSDFGEDDEDEESQHSSEEIIAVFKAFEDFPTDSNAQWAVAAVLNNSRHYKHALKFAKQARKAFTEGKNRFKVFDLLANIHLSKGNDEAAYKAIKECLSGQKLPPDLRRKALVTKAKIEVSLENPDDALVTYEEARLADPEEPMSGDILQNEVEVYFDKGAYGELITQFKKWKPVERLSYMTWNYDDDDDGFIHWRIRKASAVEGEVDFLVQAYQEVIRLLDNVDAGAPMRYELAACLWDVRGDAEAAKILLNEILDVISTGDYWRFTNDDPAITLVNTIELMADIIYDQFRNSPDPVVKSQLLAEVKTLTQTNLARSIAPVRSQLTHQTVVIARMARKIGPMQEYHENLDKAFNICFEALTDNVGWNDDYNLTTLAEVLAHLGGLEKEARILLSALFSELSPAAQDDKSDTNGAIKEPNPAKSSNVNDNKNSEEGEDDTEWKDDSDEEDGEEDDDEDEESLPDDEGDLSGVIFGCTGECYPTMEWRAWKGRPMYQCIICCSFLCEACYLKRQAYNNGAPLEQGMEFCGLNHKYLKGPVEGWKGVKDGLLMVEGMEPVKLRDWLDDLKTNKWKAAWERFWLAEEGI